MNFRIFLVSKGEDLFLAHTKNAATGVLSDANWDIFADEGGVVTWIAYLSGSVSFEEYEHLTQSQHRQSASWTFCADTTYTVDEAAWFNAMFTWGVRSLAGFPISDYDAPGGSRSLYGPESLVPNVKAHLAYGDCLGFDHPAFSDAMTQSEDGEALVGWVQNWYIPPNIPGSVGKTPNHVVPHALFVPFNAGPDLDVPLKTRLLQKITDLRDDQAGYYHDSGPYPFGFEVIASPYKDDLTYDGADDGRNVFETLSQAYIVLSLFNALQLDDGKPTFYTLADFVPGYSDSVREVLQFLYPSPSLRIQDKDPSWSPDGEKIVFVSNRDGNWEIYVASKGAHGSFDFGNATRLTFNNADDLCPAWSPDGDKIAFISYRDGVYRLYIMDSSGTSQTPITDDLCACSTCWPEAARPTWSPDGEWIAFASKDNTDYCRYSIYKIHADGTGLQRLTDDPYGSSGDTEPAWSPSGGSIAYVSDRTGKWCLTKMDAGTGQGSGTGDVIKCPVYPEYSGRCGQPAWSPNGQYIAYVRMDERRINITDTTGGNDTVLVGGQHPDWSPDGKWIAYDSGGQIFIAAVPTAAVFRVDWTGDVLADGPFYGTGYNSGSADVAEWVQVSELVEPGDVLELDPDNPGHYRKSRGPCSDLVAGVVSTAPGFVLGSSSPTLDVGPQTVDSALLALIGIVPVKVIDEGDPIQAGDLLVTSSMPGYAMRWNPEDGSPCDLVGKALESMSGNQGVISVLLTVH